MFRNLHSPRPFLEVSGANPLSPAVSKDLKKEKKISTEAAP